ncbi:trk system potassium uptake protein TrkH [Kibdelosporangium aridum]|uniref:Trk system potassium uptake protein TrkH n=1 Tax=Kibdelosporangium aridum TaxID=2030 RepID=A0A1W2FVS7_KIBAR|nr:trk system potassium uptake protein TrkH [Kibdelosporangium aridum]
MASVKGMRPIKSHPARTVVIGFGGAVLFGTFLLSLPFATAAGESARLVTALFTATSAVCVTATHPATRRRAPRRASRTRDG